MRLLLVVGETKNERDRHPGRPLLAECFCISRAGCWHTVGMSDEPAAPGAASEPEAEPEFELTEASGVSVSAIEPTREPNATPARSTISPGNAVELLSKISLFSALQPSYLRRIANLGIEEDYQAGGVIFKEGDQGDKMYLILSGAVRIGRQVPGMGEEALAVLRAGTHFGEMALIDDFPRSADARAHEACKLFVIRKEDMEDLLFVDRDLAYDLLWSFIRTLSSRLRETNDKMTFMAVTSKF